jgi:hypothetical protein
MSDTNLISLGIIAVFTTWFFGMKYYIGSIIDSSFSPIENKIKAFRESQKITEADRDKINFIEGYECNMRFHAELEPNACQQPQNLVDEYNRLTVWLNDNYSTYSDYKNDVSTKQYTVRFKKS